MWAEFFNENKMIIGIVAIVALSLITLLYIILKYRRSKAKIKIEEEEEEAQPAAIECEDDASHGSDEIFQELIPAVPAPFQEPDVLKTTKPTVVAECPPASQTPTEDKKSEPPKCPVERVDSTSEKNKQASVSLKPAKIEVVASQPSKTEVKSEVPTGGVQKKPNNETFNILDYRASNKKPASQNRQYPESGLRIPSVKMKAPVKMYQMSEVGTRTGRKCVFRTSKGDMRLYEVNEYGFPMRSTTKRVLK